MLIRGFDNHKLNNCSTCIHCYDDGEYEMGQGYEWLRCDKNENYSNLKSFPFKKTMPCFQKEFWFTEFAKDLKCCECGFDFEKQLPKPDGWKCECGSENHNDNIFKKYREKYAKLKDKKKN